MDEASVPVACTLTTKQAAAQLLAWDDLRSLATTVATVAGGARMTFPAHLTAQVEDLARRERACCAFLTITTAIDGDELTVELTAEDPDAAPVIALLAGLSNP